MESSSGEPSDTQVSDRSAQEVFEDMGKKVEGLSLRDQPLHGEGLPSQQENVEQEPKVVEEIESLCMNCHEQVGQGASVRSPLHANTWLSGHHTSALDSNPLLPRSCHHVIFVPSLPLPEFRDTVRW